MRGVVLRRLAWWFYFLTMWGGGRVGLRMTKKIALSFSSARDPATTKKKERKEVGDILFSHVALLITDVTHTHEKRF